MNKNCNRETPTFANINLLGKCNCDCFFCLGKDIPQYLGQHNQLSTPFTLWKNFELFLDNCKRYGIQKLYITGQNCDSLQYKYLIPLISKLQDEGFFVGLRTNGYLAEHKQATINDTGRVCSTGYSIHSLKPYVNKQILGRIDIPNWNNILTDTTVSRVAIVINRYNYAEFFELLAFISQFNNVKYIQARRISTETREEELKIDIKLYEDLYHYVSTTYKKAYEFYSAEVYNIMGKEVCFWRTVETTVNSINYFTDGTISNRYFIVEGYCKENNLVLNCRCVKPVPSKANPICRVCSGTIA